MLQSEFLENHNDRNLIIMYFKFISLTLQSSSYVWVSSSEYYPPKESALGGFSWKYNYQIHRVSGRNLSCSVKPKLEIIQNKYFQSMFRNGRKRCELHYCYGFGKSTIFLYKLVISREKDRLSDDLDPPPSPFFQFCT